MKFLRKVGEWLRILPRRDAAATFEFWDGAFWCSVDPIEAWAKMDAAAGGNWTDLFRLVATPAPAGLAGSSMEESFAQKKQDSALKLAEVVCAAFEVLPYKNGVGLTVPERIALATEYLDYMGGLAAKARPFSLSPSPTGDSPPESPVPS